MHGLDGSFTPQQGLLRLFHTLKVETLDGTLHQCGNLIITQIANTSFMGVMYLLVMRKVTGFNIQPYFLISIPEWHTFTCQTIHLFYTKNKKVKDGRSKCMFVREANIRT